MPREYVILTNGPHLSNMLQERIQAIEHHAHNQSDEITKQRIQHKQNEITKLQQNLNQAISKQQIQISTGIQNKLQQALERARKRIQDRNQVLTNSEQLQEKITQPDYIKQKNETLTEQKLMEQHEHNIQFITQLIDDVLNNLHDLDEDTDTKVAAIEEKTEHILDQVEQLEQLQDQIQESKPSETTPTETKDTTILQEAKQDTTRPQEETQSTPTTENNAQDKQVKTQTTQDIAPTTTMLSTENTTSKKKTAPKFWHNKLVQAKMHALVQAVRIYGKSNHNMIKVSLEKLGIWIPTHIIQTDHITYANIILDISNSMHNQNTQKYLDKKLHAYLNVNKTLTSNEKMLPIVLVTLLLAANIISTSSVEQIIQTHHLSQIQAQELHKLATKITSQIKQIKSKHPDISRNLDLRSAQAFQTFIQSLKSSDIKQLLAFMVNIAK